MLKSIRLIQLFSGYYEPSHVVAICLILSEIGLSPKLLSVFGNGTIIEYIESRHFSANDYLNPKTVTLLAQKLAKFHSLQMPVPKDSTHYSTTNIFEKWFDQKLRDSYRTGIIRKHITAQNLEIFSKLDFIEEVEWYQRTVTELRSPIVFSHNDFNRRNILIQESDNNNSTDNPDIYLIDFDWSNYNYRGVDFGQYFSRWGQTDTEFGSGDFPADTQMYDFIEAYIQEMTKIYGKSYAQNEINSRERLIKESKVLALLAYIKDILYCMDSTDSRDNHEMLMKGEIRFRCYYDLKNRILKEYPKINRISHLINKFNNKL
ncbi:unnamed protein product [Oppiella nova]|uniref:Aminoglycoside phosphotransferase domain-containing protein n=1 Tax=Oppiella nova TaxID=334625 RepID=A0A7R9LVI4_9ACAR|nr:unnamed protein product [Oppiella nova]CAG2166656.1 unnamed protein product [Oppiella nova]